MKAIMISIKPKYVELIANGKKTVEVRKTRPKLETPFKCYIYCTKDMPILGRCLKDNSLKVTDKIDFDNYNKNTLFRANGKVIGEFVCDKIYGLLGDTQVIAKLNGIGLKDVVIINSCLTFEQLTEYSEYKTVYFWHISNLKIYDKPKELGEFCRYCGDDCHNDECEYIVGTRGYEYDESDCACNFYKTLKCPPQSWCYVEG